MPLTPSKRPLAEAVGLPGEAGRKLGAGATALLWQWLHEDPACPSRVLRAQVAQTQSPMAVSLRHLNRLRVKWKRNRSTGRPRQAGGSRPVASGAAVVALTPHWACVGVHLFADWLDYQESVAPVVARLIQALQAEKSAQPDDDFARGHHREQPWRRRLQALLFAPRLGIDTLTAFATHEHPLQTRVGRGYQSATLRQLLGQLERIDAATALLPALGPPQEGQVT